MYSLFQSEDINAGTPVSSLTLESCIKTLTTSIDPEVIKEAIKTINATDVNLAKLNHVTESIKEKNGFTRAEITSYDKMLDGKIFSSMNRNGFTQEHSTIGINRVLRILENHHEADFTNPKRIEAYALVTDAISPTYLASVNNFLTHLGDRIEVVSKISLSEETRSKIKGLTELVSEDREYASDKALLKEFSSLESSTIVKHAVGELRGAIILNGKKNKALNLILQIPSIAEDLKDTLAK